MAIAWACQARGYHGAGQKQVAVIKKLGQVELARRQTTADRGMLNVR